MTPPSLLSFGLTDEDYETYTFQVSTSHAQSFESLEHEISPNVDGIQSTLGSSRLLVDLFD